MSYNELLEFYRNRPMSKSDKKAFDMCIDVVEQPHLPRIYMIGDSISLSCTPYVRNQLANVANVIRPPLNCRSSRFGLENIDRWISIGEVDMCLVNFGIHDTIGGAIPYDEYAVNLSAIFSKLKNWCKNLAWVTTTPYYAGAETHTRIDLANYDKYVIGSIALAQEADLKICDISDTCQLMDRTNDVQIDGCHFLPSGYEKISKNIVKFVYKTLNPRKIKLL